MIIVIMLVGQVRSDSWESWGFSGGMWWVPPLLQVHHDHHDHGDGDHGHDDHNIGNCGDNDDDDNDDVDDDVNNGYLQNNGFSKFAN